MYKKTIIQLAIAITCIISAPFRTFSQGSEKPYIILISADGFRHDYTEKFSLKNLQRLSKTGVRAKSMTPSYPSVTRPNHYAIVTGLYPGHTGIAGNAFYDPKEKRIFDKSQPEWFTSESIWQTASKAGLTTANINYPDARTITKGIKDVYQIKKTKAINIKDQLQAIASWLSLPKGKRPQLITLYFNDTDHQGHLYGPDAPQVKDAALEIDHNIGCIDSLARSTGLPVDIIFLSDHGMTTIQATDAIAIPKAIDTAKFTVNNQNSLVNLYAKDPSHIGELHQKLTAQDSKDYQVYLNAELPSNWHYGGRDDRHARAGDLILVPSYRKTFNTKPGKGMHGFDPQQFQEMGATFIAWGPSFKKQTTIASFGNVEVYGLIATMLGIKASPNDGTGRLSKMALR